MSSNIDISVILVVYNTKKWIEECLNSIFAQTFTNFELIIINNDNDEELDAIIKKSIDQKNNVIYIQNKKNTGGAEACNQGIKIAKGRYIFLMDSDDKLPKSSLKRLITKADKHDSDIVIGRGKILRNDRLYNLDYVPDWITWEREVSVNDIRQAPFLSFNPYYWGRLYKRKMLTSNKIYLEKGAMNADRNFNCKAFMHAKKICTCTGITYHWRKHDTNGDSYQSVTRTRSEKSNFEDRMRMMEKTDKLFRKKGWEQMYAYSRISGLMRLLILAVDTAGNEEFRELYLKEMHKYLKSFCYEEISECEFLTYRVKTLAYLIKSKRFDDFKHFISMESKHKHTAEDDKVVYEYDDLEIPLEFRTQNRFFIPEFNAEVTETEQEYSFSVHADIWDSCKPELACVYLMNKGKREKMRLKAEKTSINNKKLFFGFNLSKSKLDSLKEGSEYYFTVCYIIHSRVSRTKLTDKNGDVIAVCRTGNSIELKNGNSIFEKK
ncbi:MAG: glycosyltransferase [Acetobacter sp.]|nr:glycosyltransferase [Bacteroides sp.]MCM1341245.1 glycosyltransferase [Acetobacter sp.]MCM1433888.1 glycosyltransferase [Clostridiales bacterium]